jgi:hypothetical protein
MSLQQSETKDLHKYLTLLYRVLLQKFVVIRVKQNFPLSGHGIRMYDIAVSALKTEIDLNYIPSVNPRTHSASDIWRHIGVYYETSWNRVFLVKISFKLVKKSPAFYFLLPPSQKSTVCLCPASDQSSLCSHSTS